MEEKGRRLAPEGEAAVVSAFAMNSWHRQALNFFGLGRGEGAKTPFESSTDTRYSLRQSRVIPFADRPWTVKKPGGQRLQHNRKPTQELSEWGQSTSSAAFATTTSRAVPAPAGCEEQGNIVNVIHASRTELYLKVIIGCVFRIV